MEEGLKKRVHVACGTLILEADETGLGLGILVVGIGLVAGVCLEDDGGDADGDNVVFLFVCLFGERKQPRGREWRVAAVRKGCFVWFDERGEVKGKKKKEKKKLSGLLLVFQTEEEQQEEEEEEEGEETHRDKSLIHVLPGHDVVESPVAMVTRKDVVCLAGSGLGFVVPILDGDAELDLL